MTAQTSTPLDRPLAVPESIESSQAKLVYLYLNATSGATVDELHDRLDLDRLSLFPVLETLRSHGLVVRDGETYVAS
jgi:predicted transcriptional regulator